MAVAWARRQPGTVVTWARRRPSTAASSEVAAARLPLLLVVVLVMCSAPSRQGKAADVVRSDKARQGKALSCARRPPPGCHEHRQGSGAGGGGGRRDCVSGGRAQRR
uniref:Uncharacterized protein n=1 Tax=Oryza nivara TaxID=4536 RepID=A0A0E0J0X8_ORYNI